MAKASTVMRRVSEQARKAAPAMASSLMRNALVQLSDLAANAPRSGPSSLDMSAADLPALRAAMILTDAAGLGLRLMEDEAEDEAARMCESILSLLVGFDATKLRHTANGARSALRWLYSALSQRDGLQAIMDSAAPLSDSDMCHTDRPSDRCCAFHRNRHLALDAASGLLGFLRSSPYKFPALHRFRETVVLALVDVSPDETYIWPRMRRQHKKVLRDRDFVLPAYLGLRAWKGYSVSYDELSALSVSTRVDSLSRIVDSSDFAALTMWCHTPQPAPDYMSYLHRLRDLTAEMYS